MLKKKIKSKKSLKKPLETNTEDEWEITEMTEEASYCVPETDCHASHLTDQQITTVSAEEITTTSNTKRKLKNGVLIQRSEASQNISEFNLTEVGKEKVKLNELIKTSQKISGQVSMKKQLENAKKLKSLSIPLSKPQLEKIKRTVAYEKICDEVTKWEPVVRSNRAAEQVTFPLKKPELRLESFEKVAENFVTKHPVEIAVDELLKKSENNLSKTQPLTVAEEKALQAMSLEEAKLRHNELMKHRALISYQEARARRQNKIKSKRYHRILKREKLKKIMKEFEALQKVDAAAALEKIMEADKLRVLERMTLKHRNTGKWAKMQKLRAKYNPEARSILKEDINIGRQLKEKLPEVEKTINDLKAMMESQGIDEAHESIYESGLNEEATAGQINLLGDSDVLASPMELEADLSLSNQALPDTSASKGQVLLLDKFALEKHLEKGETLKGKKTPVKAPEPASEFVDMDFISKTTALNSYNPSGITIDDHMDQEEGCDELDDDVEEGVKNVSEAFADEEIIAEFREDKRSAELANRPKGIDLFLPGWGSWGGAGIKESKKKRKQFYIKPLEEPTAKKKNTLGNVIINEDKDKKASVHQVSHVPFPFSNVHQFESYIRQPIGHTWNPQSSFQNLIVPKVITKMGKIIEPIDAEDVVLGKKIEKKQPRKKRVKISEQRAF